MSKKEKFIELVEKLLEQYNKEEYDNEALEYWQELKENKNKEITDKGIMILSCMQEKQEQYMNLFSSKVLGEELFMSSRSVSGTMRKLVTDGYVEKTGTNPVMYSLTEKGKEYK